MRLEGKVALIPGGYGGWGIRCNAESSWSSATGSVVSPGASTQGTLTPADVRTDKAWYQGRLYVAQWYARGDVPGAKKNNPWKLA